MGSGAKKKRGVEPKKVGSGAKKSGEWSQKKRGVEPKKVGSGAKKSGEWSHFSKSGEWSQKKFCTGWLEKWGVEPKKRRGVEPNMTLLTVQTVGGLALPAPLLHLLGIIKKS